MRSPEYESQQVLRLIDEEEEANHFSCYGLGPIDRICRSATGKAATSERSGTKYPNRLVFGDKQARFTQKDADQRKGSWTLSYPFWSAFFCVNLRLSFITKRPWQFRNSENATPRTLQSS